MTRLNDSRIASVLDDRYAVRASTRTTSTMHAQHGVALFVTLEREMSVVAQDGTHVRGRAVLVPADVEHEVRSDGPTIGICFDPERMPQVALRARREGRAFALGGREARTLVDAARGCRGSIDRSDTLRGLADEWAAAIGAGGTLSMDARVSRAVDILRHDEPLALHDEPLALRGISRAHLTALFVRDVGTSLRTYRLWRRLLRALRAFATADATTAAHAARFADLAHFSRTCRRMLGYTPTGLRDGV